MKRILLVLACIVALVLPAFAADESAPDPAATAEPVTVETSEGEKDIVVNVTVNNSAADPASETSEEVPVLASVDDDPAESYTVLSGTIRDTSAPASDVVRTPLLEAVLSLFGEYTPKTYSVTTYLADGTVVTSQEYVPGFAGLDWPWLASAALFAMALYCIFRMIGGLFRWK